MQLTRNKKVKLIFVCLCIISMLFSGCSPKNIESKSIEKQEMITITDCSGREVKIPKNIERVACLFSSSAHITSMFGKSENITAVSKGNMHDKLYLEMFPSIKNAATPKGGGNFNIEELINSKPDVIFFFTDVIKDEAMKKKIDEIGIPYLIMKFDDGEKLKYAVQMVGKAFGQEEKAKKYGEYYDECVKKVHERVKNIPENKRLTVYHAINEVSRTDSLNTLPAEWMKTAGAVNVSIEQSKFKEFENSAKIIDTKCFVSFEQICLWNPDVIMVNGEGIDKYIKKSDKLKDIKAVIDDKVYLMPNGITRWGHPNSIETPLAILWTAKTLYPQYFEDVDMKYEISSFYKDFYNYDLSDDQVEKILSGKDYRKPKKNLNN